MFCSNMMLESYHLNILPRSLTWNLKINPCKRRFLLETIIFRFHVKFRGCILDLFLLDKMPIVSHCTLKICRHRIFRTPRKKPYGGFLVAVSRHVQRDVWKSGRRGSRLQLRVHRGEESRGKTTKKKPAQKHPRTVCLKKKGGKSLHN